MPHYFIEKDRKFRYITINIIIENWETILQASIEQKVSNSGRKLSKFPYFSKVWIVSIDISLEEKKSAVEFVSCPESTASKRHSTAS